MSVKIDQEMKTLNRSAIRYMDINIGSWDRIIDKFADVALGVGVRAVAAIVLYIIGRFLIRKLVQAVGRLKSFKSLDVTAAEYITTAIKTILYIGLIMSIVALLGVPMSSIIAIVASIGVAIGMGMQGALSNIAGGIMLLIFRPFNVGDYISTSSGEEGYVKSISLVYTVLRTFDNRIISMPNGGLMNANIINATSEPLRRVDLKFDIASSESPDVVRETIMDVIKSSEFARSEPTPQIVPTAQISGGMTYAVRVWTDTVAYWNLYEQLMEQIPIVLNNAKIARPVTPIRLEK